MTASTAKMNVWCSPSGAGFISSLDMAGSVNKVILVGNLGKDPEVRRFQNGGQVVNFTLATTESWKDKATGERKEKTEWHNVAIFNEDLRRDRRAIPQEGLEGLRRGSAADPQVAGQGRQRAQHDGSRAAGLQQQADAAGRPRRDGGEDRRS